MCKVTVISSCSLSIRQRPCCCYATATPIYTMWASHDNQTIVVAHLVIILIQLTAVCVWGLCSLKYYIIVTAHLLTGPASKEQSRYKI